MQSFYSSNSFSLWLGLTILALSLIFWLFRLNSNVNRMIRQYRMLTRNVGVGNLETILEQHLDQAQQTAQKLDDLNQVCLQLERTLQRCVQNVDMVRFNPFNDTGGDQSFSVAFLDGMGDGLILSSIFSRAGTRVFAKPIHNGQSKYTLSEEESQAIRQAIAQRTTVRLQ